MAELDPVTQEFIAQTGPYVAGVEAAIAATDAFRESVDAALFAVEALHAAIDDLPELRVINIRIETTGNIPEAAAAAAGTEGAAPDTAGMAAEAAATEAAGDAANEADADYRLLAEAEDDAAAAALRNAAAMEAERAAAGDATVSAEEFFAVLDRLSPATQAAYEAQEAEAAGFRDVGDAAGTAAAATDEAARAAAAAAAPETLQVETLDEVKASYERMVETANNAGDVFAIVGRDAKGAASSFAAVDDAADEATTSFMNTDAALSMIRAGFENSDSALSAMAGNARDATIPFAAVGTAAEEAGTGIKEAGDAVSSGASVFDQYGDSATRAGKALVQASTSAFRAAAGMNSLGGIIHWVIAAGSEFAATFIPAMIAAAAGADVMLQAVVDVYDRMTAMYTATEALGTAFQTTWGQALGLGDALQQAQNVMQPQVYEIFGAALNVMKTQAGGFVTEGQAVVQVLDQFAAHINVDFTQSSSQFNSLIDKGVQDLTEFGQILGNVGHALLNFASDMPGLAEVLLKVIDGISSFILAISNLPPMLITVVMGIEEAYRWSGLLAGIFGLVGTAIEALATLGIPIFVKIGANVASMMGSVITGFAGFFATLAEGAGKLGAIGERIGGAIESGVVGPLTTAADFLAGPWGAAVGLAVAALGAFIIWTLNSKSATQAWVDSMEASVNQAKGLQQIGETYQDLTAVTNALVPAQQKLTSAIAAGGEQAGTVASRLAGPYNEAVTAAGNKVVTLSGAQQQLSQDFGNEIGNVQMLASSYKISYVEAAELAGDAGANLTTSMKGNSVAAQENLQMIKNYVTGLGGMGAVTTSLGQDINAVTVATGLQNSQVTKLNQSWDTVMQTVQGTSSGFLSFAQSLQQYNSDAATTGATMTGLGGATTKVAKNVTSASIQLQTDFNTSASAANTLADNLRTSAAVTGNGGPLIQGIKDTIAVLIPLAGSNTAAAAQIKVLAQEAGLPATDSLKQLAQATSGTKNPMQDLQTLSNNAAMSLANLGNDAQNLASVINSTLNQTLVNQAETLTGVSAKTATYLSDLQHLGAQSPTTQAALASLNGAQSQANALASQGASGISALSGQQQNYSSSLTSTKAAQDLMNSSVGTMIKQMPGGTGDLNNFAKSALTSHGNLDQMHTSAAAVASMLVTVTGNTNTAHAMFDTLAEALGLSKQQADQLWGSLGNVTSGLHNAAAAAQAVTAQMNTAAAAAQRLADGLNAIPSQKTIQVAIQTSGSVGSVVASVGQATKSATGMLVPGGYGGGDTVPAMLEPGETVVPKHLTASVAPLMKAHGVPGFEGGGIIGSDGARASYSPGGGAPQTIHVPIYIDGNKIAEAMVPYQSAAAGRYQLRNSGRTTGAWGTGWKT